MKNNKEFQFMMRGGVGFFSQYEMWTILSHQNELGINTISIQKDYTGKFVCMVDKPTIERYKEECSK
jgi:hypothetical protein